MYLNRIEVSKNIIINKIDPQWQCQPGMQHGSVRIGSYKLQASGVQPNYDLIVFGHPEFAETKDVTCIVVTAQVL